MGTNTVHFFCIVGVTVWSQLTATFDPDRPWLFGAHFTRSDTAHLATRIFRFGSMACHFVPFFRFSAAINCTAASLISNNPCMSPRVRSSSSVLANADEAPATRKKDPARVAYTRLFNRNGSNIFIILCQICSLSDKFQRACLCELAASVLMSIKCGHASCLRRDWKRPFLRGKAIMKYKGNAKIMKVIKSNANDAVTSYERE